MKKNEIECPDCQGFGFLKNKETGKSSLCKTCLGNKVIEIKPRLTTEIWD